ncbi:MAG: hypothetical protein M3R04_10870, partial [bacterium]|nr:hypothetical protein [bacterium]
MTRLKTALSRLHTMPRSRAAGLLTLAALAACCALALAACNSSGSPGSWLSDGADLLARTASG